MESLLLWDLSLIIIIATIGALLARWIKQPVIPAYIIAGILLGPIWGLITNQDLIKGYAEIGIAFVLFIVGMELDLSRIKNIGLVASLGGLAQVIITFCVGYFASLLLGFGFLGSAYLGLVVAFSSTFVVIKLLSDSHQIDSLHGRIVIGILLVQDIVAIIALSVFSSLNSFSPMVVALAIGKGLSLFIAAYLLAEFVVPHLFRFAAKNNEMLFLTSLAVLFSFSLGATFIGYSIAIGGFIAGFTLGNLPYRHEIIGRVKPLRDFFATLFFVSLGLEITNGALGAMLTPLIVLVLLVILVKPFIIIAIASVFGYSIRTSFLAGLSMAQISEFSLILLLQGLHEGHITQNFFSFVVLATMITIAFSSYFMKYDKILFSKIGKKIKLFKRFEGTRKEIIHLPHDKYHALMVGGDRVGSSILKELQSQKHRVLVIDFNPELLHKLIKKKVPCMYGDIADPEITEKINFKPLWLAVCTAPDFETNAHFIKLIKRKNKKCAIMATTWRTKAIPISA